MILCIEQGQTVHVVYEVPEPSWGGIGTLTAIDLEYARAHAQKLIKRGQIAPFSHSIALYDDHDDVLDRHQGAIELTALSESGA